MFDFNTEIYNAYENESAGFEYLESIGEEPTFDTSKIVIEHSKRVLPYLNRQFDKSIMALADKSYPKDVDGYECIQVRWKKDLKLLNGYILDEYEIEIE